MSLPLPLTQSISSHSQSTSKPQSPPSHLQAHAQPAHAHVHAHAHAHAHAQAAQGAHAQYALGLPTAPAFLSNPSLFNIKSEPSTANGYESYTAHSGGHYHSQQHYLHALQVSVMQICNCINQ